jgi:DNA-directed RNA polymerase subunit RPC12/RpoP
VAVRKRARAERRQLDRDARKLIEARERLARLEPGGDPSRPIEVPSASVLEVRALGHRCLACDAELRVHEHRAQRDLRELELACKQCGRRRLLWMRVSLPS